MYLTLDFETRSELDLKAVGIYRYTKHKSTRILCCAWRIDDGGPLYDQSTKVFFDMAAIPFELMGALIEEDVDCHAHNAAVERLLIENICGPQFGWPVPKRHRWACSAARVGRLAIPRKLEKAAIALRVPVQKDTEGAKVMKRLCQPLRPRRVKGVVQNTGAPLYDDDPAKMARLGEYCKTDVDAEHAIEKATFPLTPSERNRYLLIERMNDRGVRIDIPLVKAMLRNAQEDAVELNTEMREITQGAVPSVTNPGALKRWIENETGILLATLRKEDIENMDPQQFEDWPHVARAIELRQLGGKSSVSKLRSILDRTCDDGILRGAFVSFATSTGRLTSYGVQLHNLPRECLKDYDARVMQMGRKLPRCEEVISLDSYKPGKALSTVPSGPLSIKEISTAIRGVIIPDHPDDVFVDADFNAIEARGVGWLAAAWKLIDQFAEGGDPYCAIGCVIYGRKITKEDVDERFVGKQTILGCGYGMGPPKFEAQCIKFGKPVGQVLSQKAVSSYRSDYPEIPALWKGLEKAAIAAIKRPGSVQGYRDIEFRVSQGYLKMRLPSGRLLYYADPRLMEKRAPWDAKLLLPVVSYMAEHPLKKLWCRETTWGGKLTENAVQALCGDLLWEAKIRLERRGILLRLSVHDQVVVQARRSNADEVLRVVKGEMERGEDWSKGFPIKAEPKIMQRFGK